jgi:hypothetical protein
VIKAGPPLESNSTTGRSAVDFGGLLADDARAGIGGEAALGVTVEAPESR